MLDLFIGKEEPLRKNNNSTDLPGAVKEEEEEKERAARNNSICKHSKRGRIDWTYEEWERQTGNEWTMDNNHIEGAVDPAEG